MIFFDTTYLARLYLDEPGANAVRELAKVQPIVASWHAQAELLCTFHRAFREGRLDLADQFHKRDKCPQHLAGEAGDAGLCRLIGNHFSLSAGKSLRKLVTRISR